jgi:DNA-directed RNA polymerase specialized sigma24 family protein
VRQNSSLARDLTNHTLEKIFLKYDTCQSAFHFLRWAEQIAFNEFLQHKRNLEKRINQTEINPVLVRLHEKFSEENLTETLEKVEAKEEKFNPETRVINRERIGQIVERIEQIKPTKRGKYYKEILYGTYFLELNDEELSLILGLPLIEIQKMRSYVLKLLRSDRMWIDTIR